MSERRPWKRLKATVAVPSSNVHSTMRVEPSLKEGTTENSIDAGVSRRRGKPRPSKLKMLPEMPLDILFHIFTYLHPKDLINISRTSRICCDTLLASNAANVWRTVRRQYDAPDPFPDRSEPRWANFLFGGTSCEVCGRARAKPDFRLRRRVCKSCFWDRTIDINGYYLLNPTAKDCSDLELVPFAYVWYGSDKRRWWKSDVERLVAAIQPLKDLVGISAGKAEEKLRVHAFRSERLSFIKKLDMHAIVCSNWFDNFCRTLSQQKSSQQHERAQSIIKRFVRLGYEEQDISRGLAHLPIGKGKPLNDRSKYKPAATIRPLNSFPIVWNRIKATQEPLIQAEKRQRLLREKPIRIQLALKSSYERYVKERVPAAKWRQQIPLDQFLRLPEIVRARQVAESCLEEIPDDIFDLVAGILITSWPEKRRRAALASLHEDPYGCSCPLCSNNPTIDCLNLATAVFTCRCQGKGGTTFVFSDAHSCIDGRPTFSPEGHSAARMAVLLAALDPDTASVQDMDRCGALFCFHNTVYDWRRIIPILQMVGPWQGCRILTMEEKVKVWFVADPAMYRHCWACTHCVEHYNNWSTHAQVSEHAKGVHGIANPKTGQDIALGPGFDLVNDYMGILSSHMSH